MMTEVIVYEESVDIQRNIHPYKHISVLSHFANFWHKGHDIFPANPPINPPRRSPVSDNDRSPAEKKLIESMDQNVKAVSLIVKMLPAIAEKYPWVNILAEECIPHVNFMTDYWQSAVDNRYSRSMVEWYHIAKYAEEKSVIGSIY